MAVDTKMADAPQPVFKRLESKRQMRPSSLSIDQIKRLSTHERSASGSSFESEVEGFRVEDGSEAVSSVNRAALQGNILLENPEAETRWYFKYFLGHQHQNFMTTVTLQADRDLIVVSVKPEDGGKQTRAILWSKKGSERLMIPTPTMGKGKVDIKRVIDAFGRGTPDKKIDEITSPNLQDGLLQIEEQEGAVHFKIGILYAKKGQVTDDEMFSNEHGSPDFDEFCSLMGTKTELDGYKGYRGGLDVKGGSTGTHCVQTVELGKEIMFHVSTLLPYSKENPQQLERKRHLGNDICNIVYQEDSDTPFDPDQIKSKFNHIFAVVSKDPTSNAYTLRVYTKNCVPGYGPPLPTPNVFPSAQELRHFLLVKLMNAEKAALSSPLASFARKKQRTLEALLEEIRNTYLGKKIKGSPSITKKKGRETFREKGQALKITKVASAAAPTSTMSVGVNSVPGTEPWAAICITAEFPHRVICGDSWNNDLVVSTLQGVFRIVVAPHLTGRLKYDPLVEAGMLFAQITVDEKADMMVFRTAKSIAEDYEDKVKSAKGGQVYAIPLKYFDSDSELPLPLTKKILKKHAVPNTKDCHLFATDQSGTAKTETSLMKSSCKLAVACGKKLRTFQYIPPTQPASLTGKKGTPGAFRLLHEFTLSEIVKVLSIGNGELLSLGLMNGEFHIVELEDSNLLPLWLPDESAKTDPIACTQVPDSNMDGNDFLVSYNQTVLFKNILGEDTRDFGEVKWHSRPQAVAYVYPYLLGFTSRTVEVVTLINGNLVKSVEVPNLKYITSKADVFFVAPSDDNQNHTSIFKMSSKALSGKGMEEASSRLPNGHIGSVYGRKMSSTALLSGLVLDAARTAANTSQLATITAE